MIPNLFLLLLWFGVVLAFLFVCGVIVEVIGFRRHLAHRRTIKAEIAAGARWMPTTPNEALRGDNHA